MTTTQLEMCVIEQFNMGLREFMRHKVEVESLYDYELAGILNVDASLISRLRKTFGIKKANGFSRRFESRYGRGAVDTFKKTIEHPGNSLVDAARQFRFSREYARQVYKKVYGRPYTEAFRRKMLTRKRKNLDAKMKTKKFKSLIKIVAKMRSLGFVPRIANKGPAFTILANGHKLGLRSTSKSAFVGRKHYFRISQGPGSNRHYDFLICLCKNNEESIHYVIPRHAMPKYGVYLIPEAGPRESKYAQFKEAWHLLNRETNDMKHTYAEATSDGSSLPAAWQGSYFLSLGRFQDDYMHTQARQEPGKEERLP